MKKNMLDYVMVALGLLLFGAGLFLVKSLSDPQGFMLALPYVFIGIGSGTFGHGIGNVVTSRTLKNHPALLKQMEIDQKDERNIVIANRAKAKAYDLMIFVFGALMIAFALMGVDMIAILLLVFSYLLIVGYSIYYRFQYDKLM